MNEKVENLILEHLRAMRSDILSVKDEMRGMRTEMLAIRQHMAGLLGTQNLIDGDVATIKVRLDRVERRLDLTEE